MKLNEKIPRKMVWDDRGAAEVVGTILILMITVTLFSGIILWVNHLPEPEQSTYADLSGSIEPKNNTWNDGAWINITHGGGDSLYNWSTRIHLNVGGTITTLFTKGAGYGVEGDDTWSINEIWTYEYTTAMTAATEVSVMVVDISKNIVVWSSDLLGGEGLHPPIFIRKWTDSIPSTPTADPVEDNKTFTIYAEVTDEDKDLRTNSVYVDVIMDGQGTLQMFDDGTNGDKTANDGIFTAQYDNFFIATKSWDGSLILFNATDEKNHETKTRLVLDVVDYGTTIYEGDTYYGGEGDGPGGLGYGSALQRFDIFNSTEWDALEWNGNSTRNFKKGETVVVVVASKYLVNLELKNTFLLYDSYSGVPSDDIVYSNPPYNKPITTKSVPSCLAAFTFKEFNSGFYVYVYRFNTTSAAYGYDGVQLAYGRYPLVADLKSSVIDPPNNRFWTVDMINVTDESGNVPDYPDILTFKDAAHLQPSTVFNFTDTVYVKIVVNDTDGTFAIGDVMIQDYIGGIQVWAIPGNTPVSAAAINNSVSYKFSIDLSKPNIDSWLFGLSSYGLRVKSVVDANEEYISVLGKQIQIRGPRWLLDIVNSIEEYKHPVFDTKYYGYFYNNDANWQRVAYESYQSTAQQKDPDWGSGPFWDVAFGDLDCDSDLDLVVGVETGNVFYYRNTVGDGSQWSRYVIDDNAGSTVYAVGAGYTDKDGDLDIAVGTDNGDIWHYRNDGAWTETLIATIGTQVYSIEFGDVTGDGIDDIIAGANDGNVYIYLNDGTGVFGTTATTDYVASEDNATAEGTITSGSYVNTWTSDNQYESIQEEWGTSYDTTVYKATSETSPTYGSQTGTYSDTHDDDGVYETLTEEEQYINPAKDYYILRNDVGATNSGHKYDIGTITASAGDQIDLKITSYISNADGTEHFRVGWSPDGTTFTWPAGWEISRTAEGTDTFDLDTAGFTGGQLYIYISDIDTSKKDQNTDDQLTSLKIDYLHVDVIQESGTTSTLDHIWKIPAVGASGDAYRFKVEAYRSSSADNDNFTFSYSIGSSTGPWTDMLEVSKTEDNDNYQIYVLPLTVAGNDVYIRVTDTDSTDGNLVNDTIHVDHMLIQRIAVSPNYKVVNVGGTVWDVAPGDMDNDGDIDIVAGSSSGSVYILWNGGKDLPGDGTTWIKSSGLAAGSPVRDVDVGYINSDNKLDIVAGTEDYHVYLYKGDTWTRSTIESNAGSKVLSLQVGDVNGDYWDDVVIGTEDGYVKYYMNNRDDTWTLENIDYIENEVYGLSLGDADRGVTV